MSLLLCGGDVFFASVAEPHQFYAAPALALSKIFDAPPAPYLLYTMTKFL
jgi:hypothetical protein